MVNYKPKPKKETEYYYKKPQQEKLNKSNPEPEVTELKETVPTKAEEKEIEKLVESNEDIKSKVLVCSYCSSGIGSVGIAEFKEETKVFNGDEITVYVSKCGNCAATNTQNSPNVVVFQDNDNNTVEVKYGDLVEIKQKAEEIKNIDKEDDD